MTDREAIARALVDVTNRWIKPNFPEGHKLRGFDELDEQEQRLNLDYADAALGVMQAASPAQPATEQDWEHDIWLANLKADEIRHIKNKVVDFIHDKDDPFGGRISQHDLRVLSQALSDLSVRCALRTSPEDWRSRAEHAESVLEEQDGAEPVAWRWRHAKSDHWVYDPSPDWREEFKDDPAVVFEPLFAAQPPAAPVETKRTPLDLSTAELNQIATEAFGEAATRAAQLHSSAGNADALRLLAAEDERQSKLHELLETIREQIRLEVAPEHRPEGLFKNIQDAVYAMRGRTRLMDDAAITHAIQSRIADGRTDSPSPAIASPVAPSRDEERGRTFNEPQSLNVSYTLPPAPVFHPPGCICPPTSEKTCESPTCPRKGIKISAGALPRASTVAGPVTEAELATAFRYILEKPSTSYLQRKMGLGYNRAAAIMEELEAEGCISAPDESGKRSVLKRDRFADGLSPLPHVRTPT